MYIMFKFTKSITSPLAIAKCFKSALHVSSIKAGQKFVEVTQCDGIREIVLNEPKTRNSLSIGMMNSILESLTNNWQDKELRCIVLSAKGNVWSAGHNLKELISASDIHSQKEIFEKLSTIILNIYRAPVPVIAKINGLAAAAGCQLAASCDIIVASQTSSFSTPGANFGIFCSTPGIAISRNMERSKSAYMLMTGLPITAEEAYIAGLITRAVPEEELDNEVLKIVSAIKSKSRAVIALGKEFYYKQLNLPIEKAYEMGCQRMAENLQLHDSVEGLRSFVEKRNPSWKHE